MPPSTLSAPSGTTGTPLIANRSSGRCRSGSRRSFLSGCRASGAPDSTSSTSAARPARAVFRGRAAFFRRAGRQRRNSQGGEFGQAQPDCRIDLRATPLGRREGATGAWLDADGARAQAPAGLIPYWLSSTSIQSDPPSALEPACAKLRLPLFAKGDPETAL